jgi:hypothetical protein
VNFVDGGAVNAIYGSSAGLTGAGSQLWAQESQGVLEEAGLGDQFGASVSAWDFNGDAFADLAIGVPFEDLGDPIEPQQNEINAGAINVLYGSAAGLTAAGNQLWTQDSPDILDQAEKNDSFGKVQY